MRLTTRSFVPFTLSVAALAMLSACGGGSTATAPPVVTPPPPVTPTVTHLTGTAAVGAPMTQGILRVLDATGAVVAHNIVINADGTYDAGELTGTAPWRIEACGYTGANYGCIYSVAQAAGIANVTPLTTAMVTLATGQKPDAIMVDAGSAPSATALTAAQTQLQTGLAGTLTDSGVAANFDFTTGSLAAGTRSGYDRILDAINVTTGTDAGAFVQVTPRLGDGNLYLTTGTTTGTITTAAGAAALPLGGLETLFNKMTAAAASATACSDANIGLATVVASDARMTMNGGSPLQGAAVAAGLCQFFGHGDGGAGAMWGAVFVSPVLGRCDLSGSAPLCAVSFAIQSPAGDVQNVGSGIAVVYRDSRWQFYGDLLPIAINANAAVQRGMRLDDSTTPIQYSRALQFDIANTAGVACAVLKSRDDVHSTIAIYKAYSTDAQRMSLWTTGAMSTGASIDPSVGALRGGDDTWMVLPDGTAGDDVIRTFYRWGRTIDVSIFSDAACSTPASIDGKSVFSVDIDGMPPVNSALASLAWGSLTAETVTALEVLSLDTGTAGSFTGSWTFGDGVTGFGETTVCSAGSCGQGEGARLGQARIHPGARTSTTPLHAPSATLAAGDFKMFTLGGRDATGMNIESSFFSCTSQAVGQMCGQGQAPIGGTPPTQSGAGGNTCTGSSTGNGGSSGSPGGTGNSGNSGGSTNDGSTGSSGNTGNTVGSGSTGNSGTPGTPGDTGSNGNTGGSTNGGNSGNGSNSGGTCGAGSPSAGPSNTHKRSH